MTESDNEVVSRYDIAGSAHWYNKADMIVSVRRDKAGDAGPLELHVQTVRFRWCGHKGVAQLYYNRVNGRYSEGAPNS